MSQDSRTHYDVLGITRNARNIEVERAYRQLREQMRDEERVRALAGASAEKWEDVE